MRSSQAGRSAADGLVHEHRGMKAFISNGRENTLCRQKIFCFLSDVRLNRFTTVHLVGLAGVGELFAIAPNAIPAAAPKTTAEITTISHVGVPPVAAGAAPPPPCGPGSAVSRTAILPESTIIVLAPSRMVSAPVKAAICTFPLS